MILDYGTPGSGVIERTVLDQQGSPYSRVSTWTGSPDNPANYTLHYQSGNLNSIANAEGWGVYSENSFLTGKLLVGDLTKAGQYMEYANGELSIKGKITVTGGNAATKADVDAVQVGGRNLLGNSDFSNGLSGWYDGYATIVQHPDYGDVCKIETTQIAAGLRLPSSGLIKEGVLHTFSALVRADVPTQIGIAIDGSGISAAEIYTAGDEWSVIKITKVATTNTNPRVYTASASGGIFYIAWVKLELGNRATDWTPAPEDVDAGIAAAETSAKGYADGAAAAAESAAKTFATSEANAALTAAKGHSDTLKNRVETRLGLAQLEDINETLITGGKVRTSLLEVTDIVAAGITAGHVEGLTLNFDKGKIGDWDIEPLRIVDSSKRVALFKFATVRGLIVSETPMDGITPFTPSRVEMVHAGPNNWGLRGVKDGVDVFQLGSTNQIAGINFDDSKLYTANWELNKDGSFSLAGGKISGTAGGAVTIDGSLITQHITTNYIEGLELNFNKGKIGGFNIDSGSLTGGSTGDRVVLYPRNYIAFLSGDDYKWAGLGNNVFPVTTLTHAVGRFHNARPTAADSVANNVGVYIDVKGAGSIGSLNSNKNGRNTAVYVENGDMYIRDGSVRAVREYVDITVSGTVYNYLPVHRSFKFNIYSAGVASYNEMRLPTKEQVESHFGTAGTGGRISFDVLIVCNYESTKPLRIAPNTGVEFKGVHGNSIGYHGMEKGDTVRIIFLHNHWQISAISQ